MEHGGFSIYAIACSRRLHSTGQVGRTLCCNNVLQFSREVGLISLCYTLFHISYSGRNIVQIIGLRFTIPGYTLQIVIVCFILSIRNFYRITIGSKILRSRTIGSDLRRIQTDIGLTAVEGDVVVQNLIRQDCQCSGNNRHIIVGIFNCCVSNNHTILIIVESGADRIRSRLIALLPAQLVGDVVALFQIIVAPIGFNFRIILIIGLGVVSDCQLDRFLADLQIASHICDGIVLRRFADRCVARFDLLCVCDHIAFFVQVDILLLAVQRDACQHVIAYQAFNRYLLIILIGCVVLALCRSGIDVLILSLHRDRQRLLADLQIAGHVCDGVVLRRFADRCVARFDLLCVRNHIAFFVQIDILLLAVQRDACQYIIACQAYNRYLFIILIGCVVLALCRSGVDVLILSLHRDRYRLLRDLVGLLYAAFVVALTGDLYSHGTGVRYVVAVGHVIVRARSQDSRAVLDRRRLLLFAAVIDYVRNVVYREGNCIDRQGSGLRCDVIVLRYVVIAALDRVATCDRVVVRLGVRHVRHAACRVRSQHMAAHQAAYVRRH